jgi:DNA-binding LacI/PurR family transcriptional regulator
MEALSVKGSFVSSTETHQPVPAPITLDDLARLGGVSRATASRAINGQPGVRADVRERITRLADHLGFRPNRAARQLASGRSNVVGLVLPSDDLRVDPYAASLSHAVARSAARADLGLMLHVVASEPGRTVAHILRDGLLDGLVISSVAIGHPWVDELLDSSMPAVLIGRHPHRDEFVTVDVENRESSATAVTHLFEQGCRRVGTITGPMSRVDVRQRLDGYRVAHERAGLTVDPSLVIEGDFQRGQRSPAPLRCSSSGASTASSSATTRWRSARCGRARHCRCACPTTWRSSASTAPARGSTPMARWPSPAWCNRSPHWRRRHSTSSPTRWRARCTVGAPTTWRSRPISRSARPSVRAG